MPKSRRPLPWQGRALLRAHVRAAAAASVRPARTDRFLAYGPDPLRILLIGSGLAVGHGAATRAEAIDGQLGDRLAARTGRGVIVNNYSGVGMRLEDQVLTRLSAAGSTSRTSSCGARATARCPNDRGRGRGPRRCASSSRRSRRTAS